MDKPKKRPEKFLWVLLFLFMFLPLAETRADVLPHAQREEAEKYFETAYIKFRDRDYFNALSDLDRALKLNTYLVDYYLMHGLILHRIGKSDEAAKSIKYFLEVRPRDTAAPRILSRFRNESSFLKDFLDGHPIASRPVSSQRDLKETLGISLLQNFGIKGLGKVTTSSSGSLFIADSLGGKLWIKRSGESSFTSFEASSPVVAIPYGETGCLVLLENGGVLSLSDGQKILSPMGELPLHPSDGVLATENTLVVSSTAERRVAFFSLPELQLVKEISFIGLEKPFEPTALSIYGDWIAVADRNNEKVHVCSLRDENINFSFQSDAPRDLEWSRFGEIFIVHETGKVSRHLLSLPEKEMIQEDIVFSASNPWSLFSIEDRLYCMDISGVLLWEMYSLPKDGVPSFLSLDTPTISHEGDKESLLLNASLSGPFQTYMQKNKAVVTTVWNDRFFPAKFRFSKSKEDVGRICFLTTGVKNGKNIHGVASGKEVFALLEKQWKEMKNTFSQIVVAATIPFSSDEILQLTSFCLQNGIRLFILADTLPSLAMARAAGVTGGQTLFSEKEKIQVPSFSPMGTLRIPLPSDETSSGFPSRAILSVYLDIGVTPSRDWIPLWPDLL